MDNNTDKPFKVIAGGKDKPEGSKRTGKAATPTGLTEKQERFAQGLAAGLTNAESYRQSYDCSNMQANTIHTESSKLAASPKIDARLKELLAEKGAKNSMSALKQSERVWRGVWRLAEGENVPPAVQQSALALAAKMAGMLTDKVELETKHADSGTIERELLERLQRLSKAG